MRALTLLWTSADRRARRDLLLGAQLAVAAEVAAAALLGVSGWFLTSCALVTLRANTTWSWMYPSGTVRALALGRTGLRYTERLTSHRALLGATVALRARMVRTAGALPPRQLRDRRDGALLARLTDDVAAVGAAPARTVAPLAGVGVTAVVVVALICVANPVAGAAEALLLALALAVALRTDRRAAAHRAEAADDRAAARSALLSARAVLPELRCLDAVDPAREQVARRVERARRADATSLAALRTGRLLLRLLAALGQVAVLLLALSGRSTLQPVADAIGEVLLVAAGYELVETLPQILHDHGTAAHSARRLIDLLTRARARLLPSGPAALPRLDTPLVVHDLPVGLGAARTRWSAVLPPGGATLVTGPNGSGKSTLLNLLAGRIDSPSVLLGGSPLYLLSAATVATVLTLVEADDWLADSTVADNLRQAAPAAPDEALHAALAAAALTDLELDAPTGPMGGTLSQGQRRRLSIARAVLRDPAVLLLDEPTAGLDRPTAVRLLSGVRAALPRCALVIALPDQHHDLLPFPVDATLQLGRPAVGAAGRTAYPGDQDAA
ncbi:ATP-binding cassette domain-containing protein [Kitasatospora sp. MAP5-34]|uniref:ATP-binding cassette domain-containing protein n=1 Tax=Kitasatospora sp. MAP5-34 TaxID=3035102 RepID=UPI0024766764|nr:ATP-binding cassette domain-containing protein [Kitasatospora sp. MAP5-34]MDH6578214.1 ATP-binding cassette subfamily C protein CydC [Kitasatospora sp. MAP5-34]